MSRGHNNPNAPERPSPAIDWNAVEWWVYRTPVAASASSGGFEYRVTARELSPGEMRKGEELACTVSRCALAAVRGLLRRGTPPERLQGVVDAAADVKARQREAEDAALRARMAERRARAEQRLAEDVARLPVAA